jgi:tRNA (cytidine/uridine-2'-O-)-methyltransferase
VSGSGLSVVLYEPEIPPNTGNIARTCAATGTDLHLIEPLGFSLADRYLKRAGLDYWQDVMVTVHPDWDSFLAAMVPPEGWDAAPPYLFTTKGNRPYTSISAADEAGCSRGVLLFGPETRGLPPEVLATWPDSHYRVPMRPGQRSLNLSNTVAVVLYHLLARAGFPGMA